MFNNSETILIVFFTLLVVTLIATLGSFFSKELQFDYSRLSIISFTFYIIAAYFILGRNNLANSIAWMGLIGLYDGTIGWYLALKMNAVKKLPFYITAIIGFLFGVVTTLLCAGAKYLIAKT